MGDKLYLEKNGINIQVAESAIINGNEQLIVGNYQRDLILRTKGGIRIQVQNKFYDLLSREFLDQNGDISTGVIFVDSVQNQTFPDSVLVVELSTGKLYYNYDNNLVQINGGDENTIITGNYVSYNQIQNLSSEQKLLALLNLGSVYSNLSTVDNPYINQSIYVSNSNKHYYFKNGVWIEAYLHLVDGGVVLGNTTFSKSSENRNATLSVLSTPQTNYLNNNNQYEGLFVGLNSSNNGIGLYNDNVNSYINSHNNNIVIKINSANNTSFKNVMTLTPTGVGVNSLIDELHFLNVVGGTRTDVLSFNDILKNYALETPIQLKGYEYEDGFSVIFSEEDKWILTTDSLLVKNPYSDININGITGQTYVRDVLHVIDYVPPTGTQNAILVVSNASTISVGDILIGLEYDWYRIVDNHLYCEVLNVISPSSGEETWGLEVTLLGAGEYKTFKNYKLVKVDSSISNVENVLFDGETANIKIVSDLKQDVLPVSGEYVRPSYNNINSVFGSLSEVIDLDFNLNGDDEFGLYSNNAYLKGKAILDVLELGDELTWDGTILIIKDLEILKNRTINGYSLSASDIVLNANDVGALPISGGTMTGVINLNNNNIINLAYPINANDAANKQYVDDMIGDIPGGFNVADGLGSVKFNVPLNGQLRFTGTGDASVSFNAATNEVSIHSTGGGGGGGGDQTLSLDGTAGGISISNGNTINLPSLTRPTFGTGFNFTDWAINNDPGFYPINGTTGSIGLPTATSNGFLSRRSASGNTLNGSFGLFAANNGSHEIYMATGNGTQFNPYTIIADRDWTSSNFVDLTTNQNNIGGNKDWSGWQRFRNMPNGNDPLANSIIFRQPGSSGPAMQGAGSDGSLAFTLRAYETSGVQLTLNKGGYDAPVTSSIANGPYFAGGNVVLGVNSSGSTVVSGNGNYVYLRPNGVSSSENELRISASGEVIVRGLSGTGNRMMYVTSSGVVGTQTPGTITGSTTNSVTSTSHTHSLTLASADITGALGFTPVTTARTITLTNGTGISLSTTSAQNLSANRSWTITNSAPNATHTGDVTGAIALTIANSVVTNAKMANMPANTIKGRLSSTGAPQNLTVTQMKTMLSIVETLSATVTVITPAPFEANNTYSASSLLTGVVPGDTVLATPRITNYVAGFIVHAYVISNDTVAINITNTGSTISTTRTLTIDVKVLR